MRHFAGLAAALTFIVAVNAQTRRPPAPAPRPSAPARRDAVVPFAVGETLTYDVSWSNLLTAGSAVTRVVGKRASFGGTAYEITADGRPLPLIARLYPVYYKMDTLLDSVALLSQWTGLYSDENGRKRQTSMRFDRPARRIFYEMTTEPTAKTELPATVGAQDGLSLLYALRARAFRAGERFAVPVADDGAMYSVESETSGPERVTVKLGAVDAWNLKVTVLDRERQPVGRNVGVWISTDARRLPVKIQADLPVGSFILSLREAR